MDDDVTRSSDSLPTSEEFELIGSSTEPKLHIVGNATEEELKETLQEVLQDIEDKMLDISPDTKSTNISSFTFFTGDCESYDLKVAQVILDDRGSLVVMVTNSWPTDHEFLS
ncbi:hypothetical protein TNCV_2007941 [Trichonephila clavipes]|nr:hypothetical protein TNCV_2007941 [Trichonephila clavipes]